MAVAVSTDRLLHGLRHIDEGTAWQARVRRAMGEWMGKQTPDYYILDDRWLAVHEVRIAPDAVTVEWEYLGLEYGAGEWYEINAGATIAPRHDAEHGDVTDPEWWEHLHEQLRKGLAPWTEVQMMSSARQTLTWEATR